jgi:Zn-dependent protease
MIAETFAILALAITPKVAVFVVVFMIAVFSIVLHEVAHGLMAYWCGDPTAYRLGRITLNPIDHIDPLMTLLVPALLLWTSGGSFVFGGAKPVPVNYFNLTHIRRDPILVAAAGPATNIALALVLALVSNLCAFVPGQMGLLLWKSVVTGAIINIVLAVFNLVPIPPLDGSRIVMCLLPEEAARRYGALERYGLFIIMGLLYMGVLGGAMRPVINVVFRVIGVLMFNTPLQFV